MSIIEYMNSSENLNNIYFENLNKIKAKLSAIDGFKTSKGSVYKYKGIGETERFKTVTGENYSPSGLTVFVNPEPHLEQRLLAAYQQIIPSKKENVWIAELEEGGRYRFLWGIDDVNDPDNVFLVISNNNEIVSSTKAELIPSIGSKPFEISKFMIDDKPMAYRHMGNEITEIIEL